jgi:hypothetical protein
LSKDAELSNGENVKGCSQRPSNLEGHRNSAAGQAEDECLAEIWICSDRLGQALASVSAILVDHRQNSTMRSKSSA